ncbi:MAG: transketolase [Chloroflexi bacterium GWB2_49_20]|nr:MAG: transketolase [Chloroflexi bacterium GWB2_49_20]OGN78221.1 MAG: transketolase [Chloroflexi bacterium GWC2_49_37]OGN85257.1 MAG: transketolase [Chloroflexi bacterium GWD2_49_16]
MGKNDLQLKAINTIRFLSADMVQKANSGHPGLPMGAAAIAYTIWTRHLRHNPLNPAWSDRDRFILSGGHGSALLYSLLHLTGYALTLDDLKNFRQWGSLTPGHPEYGLTPGVETTTGPLGQGFSNGVGFAIAEKHLAAMFNTDDFPVVDHYVYAIVTDGDLMEGVASEAASLAGHLQLGKLIYLYDDNRISIDGSTDLAFTEDREARFIAYGWHTQVVLDGNDVEAIDLAIQAAKKDPRPSIILCRTQIGYGLPTRQNTSKAHGEPPGEEELNGAKLNLNWPVEPRFFIPEDVLEHFRMAVETGKNIENYWKIRVEAYQRVFPEKAADLARRLEGRLPDGWETDLPSFPADAKGMASRAASGKVLNSLAEKMPELMGGSADLAPSNLTWLNGFLDFQANSPEGRNFHFGVREHGMGAVVNGMALHKGVIPYGATFLVFSDYMRGALRISALSHIPSIWVFTHDSIGLGEDGPTHQPVEHLAALRAIPYFSVIRPADANETCEAWKMAIKRRDGPTALIFSRQSLPTLDRNECSAATLLNRGAYILAEFGTGKLDLILMASGSEVSLILQAGKLLASEGLCIRVVSFPSWDIFQTQESDYKEKVFPPDITARLAVEMGISQGWEMWVGTKGAILSIDHFGASAPANILFNEFGFTVENVILKARNLLR